jgi:DNA-directed RNA polymerase II subunit RPB2
MAEFTNINEIWLKSHYETADNEYITTKKLEKLTDLLYKDRFFCYQHLYDSFTKFIEDIIYRELLEGRFILNEEARKEDNKLYRSLLRFSNPQLLLPIDDNSVDNNLLLPEEARIRDLTYASKLNARVEQYQEIVCLQTGEKIEKVNWVDDNVTIGKIPIMVKSLYCNTNKKIAPNLKNTECKYDPGTYFIIKGSEKIILSLEKIADNRILVFTKRDINYADNLSYTCQINSKNNDVNMNVQICSIKMKKDDSIIINMTQFMDIPVVIMLRALGIETDYDIINNIVYDINDNDMINIVRKSINASYEELLKLDNGTDIEIKTQEDAIKYLSNKLKNSKRYTETNIETKNYEKKLLLLNIFKKDLFPHLETDNLIIKGKYLCLMINKLLECFLGRSDPDDRDNYVNKRIELPGILLGQLFKQSLKKMINECIKFFRKKQHVESYLNPGNVIGKIQPSIIEQILNQALATGTWGNVNKKGVAQVLQRLTYLQSVSYLRRIMVPSVDASNSKVINMRHVDSHLYGYIDSIETPEGHKVGIIKSLALSAIVSHYLPDQKRIIKELLSNTKEINIYNFEIPLINYKDYTKIFIHGEWIGFTDDAYKLLKFLKDKRMHNVIHPHVGLYFNNRSNELIINIDGGRILRPLLRVDNNKLVLTEEILDNINLELNVDKNKVNTWNELLIKYPNIIEYIDIEESENILVSVYNRDIYANSMAMKEIIKKPDIKGNYLNRYSSVYKRYSHCEIHPLLMLGTVSSNVVFADHNQAPRNYYNFSQTRQAMGIYLTSYRHRADISHILYHPQIPLLSTRGSRYTNSINIPAGENIVVAIACYTGYNQEDSIVINQSAIDRGLFRSMSLKKYQEEIKKNTQTANDDEFKKPDKNIVSGLKGDNYDKLNSSGYAPEETIIENGDVIIGKVSPLSSEAEGGKLYKDDSVQYKSNANGVIDKVWANITNADGYKMIKMRVRSERVPRVGDKFCMTGDHEVLTDKGWIRFDDLYKSFNNDIKIAQLEDDKYISYVDPINIYKFKYKGKMYKVDTKDISFNVTIEHKLYVKTDSKYNLIPAEKVVGKRVSYKNTGYYNRKCSSLVSIGYDNTVKEYDMILFILFLGYYFRYGIYNNQIELPLCYDIKSILIKLEIEYIEILEYNRIVIKEELINKMFSDQVTLPNFVFNISTDYVKILCNKLFENVTKYETTSKELADQIQRLLIHSNHSSRLEYNNSVYTVYLDRDNKELIVDQVGEEIHYYKGDVYCCQVPSHIFMMRYKGKPLWIGNCCYTEDHDILTSNGWIPINKLTLKDKVATLANDNSLEYNYPSELQEYNYSGNLYHVNTEKVDLLVTPNHRMYVSELDNDNYSLIEAEKLHNRVLKYKKNIGVYNSKTDDKFHIPKTDIYLDIDKWLLFVGILISNKHRGDSKFENKLIENYLNIQNFSYNRYILERYINELNEELDRRLPTWIWLLDTSNSKKIVLAILFGDEYFYAKSSELIDDFQRLCLHAGYSSNKEYRDIWYSKVDKYDNNPIIDKMDIQRYNGKVYCCTVKNSIIYVRRNGIPVWCGNSRSGQKGTCGITLRSEDMPYSDKGIQPDIIINPCCIPSRMTIGQLIECITGKAAALQGNLADGTPFNDFNIEDIETILKKYNFESNGTETMYCGMTGKKMQAKIFIGPTYYLRLKHMVLDKIHCLSLDHEVLTIDGWKSYDDLTMMDYIATLNQETESLEYRRPTNMIYTSQYEGKMIEVKNLLGTVNLNVTVNHRMWVSVKKDKKYGDYKFVNAEDLYNKCVKYKKSALYKGNYYKPEHLKDTRNYEFNEYLKLIGILLNNSLIEDNVIVCKNKDIKSIILKSLDILKIKCNRNKDILICDNIYLNEIISIIRKNELPNWFLKLDSIHSEIFIKYLINSRNRLYFITTNRRLADQVQQICLHAGLSADIIERNNKVIIYFNDYKYNPYVNVYKSNSEIREYEYEGPVFCLQVPNEIFYVRRDGIPCWTGNSRARGTRQLLTRQPPEGRAVGGGLKIGEMERDAIIAHGLSQFLKERLVDNSDIYTAYVCNKCGIFATKMIDRNVYYCNNCKDMNTSKITIPYAFKLLIQELMAINILPKLMPRVDEYTEMN